MTPRHRRDRSASGKMPRAELQRRLKECQRICDRVLAQRPPLPQTRDALPPPPLFDLEMQQVCATFLKRLCAAALQQLVEDESE